MTLTTITNQEQWHTWLNQHLHGLHCHKQPEKYPLILITGKWEIDFIYPTEIQKKYIELITATGYQNTPHTNPPLKQPNPKTP